MNEETKGNSGSKEVAKLIELGNKFAVVVGINEYMDASINRLNFSVRDIQDFHNILVDPERGRYENRNVKVLSDANPEKPTRNNILSKLTAMSRSASSEDSILFYFSGHGDDINDKPYFLCADSYRNTLEQTALPNELIRTIMEGSLARVKIVILDACHSGVLKGIKESGVMTKSFFDSFFPPPKGFVVMSSCTLGERSHEWPEKEHGVFSYYLLEGLEGTADRDGDKVITITDAYRYTSENVKRWAFEKGLEQNPTLDAKISGDIPFVYVGKVLEKEEPIDKSIIERIAIMTPWSKDKEMTSPENICGSLLQFVEASEIKETPLGYRFPYGEVSSSISSDREHLSFAVKASCEYKKESWDKIDEILMYLGGKHGWSSISYALSRKVNMGKLVRKLKASAFEIVSFTPEKGKESIDVNTKPWLTTTTVFKNREDGSAVTITRLYGALPRDFYSTLSPENIIEFIKDCLE